MASPRSTPWSDSYSVDGQCYCDSNFDHGVRNIRVDTPNGRKAVPEICADIQKKFGAGPQTDRTYYNTIQCGRWPANNAVDEKVCPGIPQSSGGHYSGPRCNEQGASWNLDTLYAGTHTTPAEEAEPSIDTPPVIEPDLHSSCPDPDGDGYGYFNGASCRVDGEPIIFEDNSPIFSGDICIDHDGDGWGFANGETCRVHMQGAAASPETPDTTALADCQDSDGDGYGFANGQSCRTDGQPIVLTDTTAPLFSSELCVDPDGDSWGFVNGESCRVIDGEETQGNETVATDLCHDSDGDGYGFMNGQSCRTDGQPIVLADTVTPVLSSDECIDHDGDGWGYANDASCQVGNAPAVEPQDPGPQLHVPVADSCPDPDGDGYGYADGESCRTDGERIVFTDQTAPVLHADVCIDYDDDGWGQADGVSCQVAQQGIPLSNEEEAGCAITDIPFNPTSDLLVLHHDFGRDPDDAHAAAANKVLIDQFGVQQLWLVSGTNSRWQNFYLPGTDNLMNQLYGDGVWLKANILDRSSWYSAISNSANKWLQTLGVGGHVWVAEAGTSDFTRQVLQIMAGSIDECVAKRQIHVVQHSATNELNTGRDLAENRNDDLAYVQNTVHYLKIEDGNETNSTADLHLEFNSLQANSAFISSALASHWGTHWQAAFEFLQPGVDETTAGKLDFSDTVELLHILNVPLLEVSDPTGFANRFFD